MKASWQKTATPVAVLTIGCVAVSLLLGWSSFARRINLNFYDLYFRQRGTGAVRAEASGIAIVAIDDATLARYGALPLKRTLLAEAVSRIAAAGPRLIAIDVLLVDRGPEQDDAALENALRNADQPVVLSAALEAGSGSKWLQPLPRFSPPGIRVGHVHADPDGDGVSRQVLLSKNSGRERYWAFALESLVALSSPQTENQVELSRLTETPKTLELSGLRSVIPASDTTQRTLWINYDGPDGSFPRVSLAELVNDPRAAATLKNAIVLVGVTAQGTGDRLFTPFFSPSGMPGIEIHANILNTLKSGKFLTPIGDAEIALVMLIIAALTVFTIFRLSGPLQWLSLAALGAGVAVAPYLLFLGGQIWPAFSLLLCFGVSLMVGEAWQLLIVRGLFLDSENKRRLARQQFEMATHEMRTPLASIQASSELLARYTLNPEKREQMLRLLHEESQRLARLVERFLSVERLSAGEMELRREPLALSPLLMRIAERVRPLAEHKALEFRIEPPTGSATVAADAELLEFAVTNLLTNAVKYTPGGGWVKLSWKNAAANAEIVVADNGPGITLPDQKKLFDRFFRTSEADGSTTPGFGLGLAIAREIISHHDGSVAVESAPGAGTRFTIRLPSVG
jgi:signal transduction histidine kinase